MMPKFVWIYFGQFLDSFIRSWSLCTLIWIRHHPPPQYRIANTTTVMNPITTSASTASRFKNFHPAEIRMLSAERLVVCTIPFLLFAFRLFFPGADLEGIIESPDNIVCFMWMISLFQLDAQRCRQAIDRNNYGARF